MLRPMRRLMLSGMPRGFGCYSVLVHGLWVASTPSLPSFYPLPSVSNMKEEGRTSIEQGKTGAPSSQRCVSPTHYISLISTSSNPTPHPRTCSRPLSLRAIAPTSYLRRPSAYLWRASASMAITTTYPGKHSISSALCQGFEKLCLMAEEGAC